MYPRRELDRLEAHKAALCRDIAWRRIECAEASARVVQPFAWLDRAVALGRRLRPLASVGLVPIGVLLTRLLFRRSKFIGPLLRWGPIALGVVRSLTATPSKNSRKKFRVTAPAAG